MNIILLSGGSGKRLWPISNDVRSKQFIKLFKATDSFNYRIAQIYDRMSFSRYLPTVRLLHKEGWLTDEEVSHVEAFDL